MASTDHRQSDIAPDHGNKRYLPLCFNPRASAMFKDYNFDLEQPPRYLFRTFDPKSNGYSDDQVIMSPAAVRALPHHAQDIFALDSDLAMAILEKHMNPWRKKHSFALEQEPNIDNFMSWTTSLLYAVQYAYHRRRLYGCSPDQIKICAIDVTLFSPGQFIRASVLLQAHYERVKHEDMRHHIGVRLLCYIYTFGEYLSQGVLMHRRPWETTDGSISHVISLASLQGNGLPVLYPELHDPMCHDKWALRTIYLRKIWYSDEYGQVDPWKSSREELEAVVKLAMAWFKPPFDPLHLAICLLSFRRRQYRATAARVECAPRGVPEEWMRHPVDVREFSFAAGFVKEADVDAQVDSPIVGGSKNMPNSTCSDEHTVLQSLLHRYVCNE